MEAAAPARGEDVLPRPGRTPARVGAAVRPAPLRRVLPVAAALLVAAAAGCARTLPMIQPGPVDAPPPTGPDSFLVAFQTTAGTFSVLARRDWAPLAADRFHDLVRRGFYDGVTIFRVVDGFVAQFGITDSLEVNQHWRERPIDDEPVRAENSRGRVSFARAGPRSRTFQIFINLGDNARLDTLAASGVVGYPPFAEVVAGMEVVDAFESRWGNEPSANQDSITAQGRAYLDRAFPGLDRVLTARVVRTWR